jgi:hypothetical protein
MQGGACPQGSRDGRAADSLFARTFPARAPAVSYKNRKSSLPRTLREATHRVRRRLLEHLPPNFHEGFGFDGRLLRARPHDRTAPRARRRRLSRAQRHAQRRHGRHRRHGHVKLCGARGRWCQHRGHLRRRLRVRRALTGQPHATRAGAERPLGIRAGTAGRVHEGREVRRLPRDARQAAGYRGGFHRDARSPACRDRLRRHEGREARLRAEAAHLFGAGSPHSGEDRARHEGRDADGESRASWSLLAPASSGR